MVFFSLSSFIITLRETMEAALIVGILIAYLSKLDKDEHKKIVWLGVGLAIFASLLFAYVFEVFLSGFEGHSEMLFEGIVMLLATFLLTTMILWMAYNSHSLKSSLETKTQSAITGSNSFSLFSLAFVSVFREGIETVLFLAGVTTTESISTVFISGLLGILFAIILALAMFRGSLELNLSRFFFITGIILVFFAAGLFSHGLHEFQELGLFGAETNFLNSPLWDTSSFLNDKDEAFGSFFRALFGYQDTPSLLELFAYFSYWLVISLVFWKINSKTSSHD
ncbi:MAG: FTR1 family protein [Candidatus Heimdallarchaeota archaeon]|nr:FTR1 family protein [Candidatus Heimdallarchaeota archaeon]MCK5049841.1 FTR1 family protein [Candidatus Heimdallarchaeota archaeon]